MKINTKKLIRICLYIIAAGAVLTGAGFLLGGRPGVVFSANGVQSPYTENKAYTLEKTELDPFSNVELQVGSYADVRIQPSGDDRFYLEYKLDGDYGEPLCEVKKDTLTFTHMSKPQHNLYFFKVGFSNDSLTNAYLTLYIPDKNDMGKLSIFNDCGDVSVEGLAFDSAKMDVDYGNAAFQDTVFTDLELNAESGDVKARSLTAKSILLDNEYGDVTLKDVSAGDIDLTLESGNLEANGLDVGSLAAKDEYGHMILDSLSAETVQIEMESGNVSVSALALDSLSCKNAYGNVEIELPRDFDDYTVDARCDYGKIRLPSDLSQGYQVSSDDVCVYRADGKAKGTVRIEVESGDIILRESTAAPSKPSDAKKQ